MTSIEEAIRTAHGEEIKKVYKDFSSELSTAGEDSDKIEQAEENLRQALAHAAKVLSRIRVVAKLG
jgi:hypothetical protein